MFKSKLQEVCHQRNLGLPRYSYVKDGPEQNSLFKGSVLVDGVWYESPHVSQSSKEALNEAAKLAFFRLTTGVEPSAKVPETEKTGKSSHFNLDSSDVKAGKHLQNKMQLQQFAQHNLLGPPLYSYKREGPPHALQFKASVTIGGQSFESQEYCRNLKEAENAAAKDALLSLGVLMETDTRTYKSLLQSLAQNRGSISYKTTTYGPPHQLMFFSTVEIEGQVFHGEGRKSKKLAELSAAKAAYLLLIKNESIGDLELTLSGFSSEVPIKPYPCSDSLINFDSEKIRKTTSLTSSSTAEGFEGHAIKNISSAAEGAEGHAIKNKDEEDNLISETHVNWKASSLCSSPKEGQSYPATVAPPDLSVLTITSKTEKKVETGNYLLCNKVRVYTSIPSTKFPQGTVLLPIDDHKWVAVSLDFPNQKVNG